jgi:ribosomal protein S18 acetylase RimI-like enzyme
LPIVNIVVGGFSNQMLDHVEQIATHRGYCKLTLGVLTKNFPVQHVYTKFGFSPYVLNDKKSRYIFRKTPLKER